MKERCKKKMKSEILKQIRAELRQCGTPLPPSLQKGVTVPSSCASQDVTLGTEVISADVFPDMISFPCDHIEVIKPMVCKVYQI
jgi:hypothetical protein